MKTYKVGDVVSVKCDVEQRGEIVAIRKSWDGAELVYVVRCTKGDYVGSSGYADVDFGADEMWGA